MKRSEANKAIEAVKRAVAQRQIPLPPFAYYSPEKWAELTIEEKELVECMLGWDVTDFGKNDFYHTGLVSFVFRNGNYQMKQKYPKAYCEKLLYVFDGQILPFHYHWSKTEDIINRGGGDLEVTLYNARSEDFADTKAAATGAPGAFDDTDVLLVKDGKRIVIPAGGKVMCRPGESITLLPGQYHQWQAVPGAGDIFLFEVSMCNDDNVDNRFHEAGERIVSIEEDEAPEALMISDYFEYVRL